MHLHIHQHVHVLYLNKCICSVQSGSLQTGKLASRFSNCAAQSANYPEYLSNLRILPANFISQHEINNVGRRQSEVLTIAISVNILH